MTIDAILPASAIQANPDIASVFKDGGVNPMPASSDAISSTNSFGQLVNHGIESVNRELLVSQTDLQQLATGNAQNLHQIMIRMEESRLSFQLLMQVRNRLLEAYQDVMKMQV